MVKRCIAIILSILLILSFVTACGGDKNSNDSGGSNNNDSSSAGGGNTVVGSGGKDIFKDDIKFAFITLSSRATTGMMYDTALAEILSPYDNISHTLYDGQFDVNVQNTLIQECITQGVDVILLECLDSEALARSVAEAEAAGIVLMTVNMACSATHTAHFQFADYDAGLQAGEILSNECGNTGNIVILDVPANMVASVRMGTGCQDWIEANSGMTIVAHEYIDDFSQEIANTKMRDILTKFDRIDAVYGATDALASGAIQAITAAGRTGDNIKVFGNTGYEDAILNVADGVMFGTAWGMAYEMCSAMIDLGLFLVSCGLNSVSLGFSETQKIDFPTIPVSHENALEILAISRWQYSSQFLK